MAFSNYEKKKFFAEINTLSDYARECMTENTKAELLSFFSEVDRPFLFGQVKWISKNVLGEFLNNDEIKKYCATQEQFNSWLSYEYRAMSDYR